MTVAFAPSSLPQMNIVGFCGNCGLTMNALPTQLNALTNFACGAFFCSCSISDSLKSVKYCSTPCTGGLSAIGFVESITTLPARFATPHWSSASSAAPPLTESTTMSAHFAASANVPVDASPFAPVFHAASLPGSRDARIVA